MRERIITTPWGQIRIKARLGQIHEDVLESICYCREKRKDLEDGAIKLLVDPAQVRRRSRQDGTTLQRIIEDLQQAIVEIIEPRHLACQGQILGYLDKAVRADGTPITRHDPLTGGARPLWSVTLGPVLSRLVAGDVWIGYDPAPLAQLRHGISQAVARHVLSHKRAPAGGWTRNGLIRAVSGELTEQQMRDRRREIKSDADQLAEFGIEINGDRVRVRRVEQNRGGGEQNRDGGEQNRDAWRKTAMLAGTDSGT